MQENIAIKLRQYLPDINASEISFDEKNTQPYEKDLIQFTENIQNWSHTVLEKAKLPTVVHEAKALANKYGLDCDEGCALRMVIELEVMNSSLENRDAGTAALASMKLLESVWYSSIFSVESQASSAKTSATVNTAAPTSKTAQTSTDNNMQLYQETINGLKEKYPHCNVNALRLLAATRLNVSKQELDELDITPK